MPAEGSFRAGAAEHPAERLYATAPDGVSFRKLRKRILRQTQRAIGDYAMIEPGARPRWLVCLSGGKDSYALLAALLDLHWRGALGADLLACNLDQGQPGFPKRVLPDFLTKIGVPFRIETKDTYSVVTEKIPPGRVYCSLCSRLRRSPARRGAPPSSSAITATTPSKRSFSISSTAGRSPQCRRNC
jgi:tRNA 2-thiocytidine biosynthesis protein TtcA